MKGKKISLYIMLFIPIIYFIVFHYLPLGGIVVAFKQYNIFQGIWDSPWVGLAHFKEVFASEMCIRDRYMSTRSRRSGK